MLMNILLILLILLAILIVGLLFLPLIIRIDTVEDRYEVRWKGFLEFRLITKEDLPALRMHVPFYTKDFELTGRGKRKNKTKKKKQLTKEKEQGKRKSRMTPKRVLALLRSFKIRQFYVSLDTGDYVNNALLVPLFQWITNYGNQVEVNFNGDTIIRFTASNNIWRLGTTYLRTAGKN